MNRYLTKEDTQMANKHMKRCCTSYTIESESEVAQPCPTLCDPMDCSKPGSSIHGISQARILEWIVNSFSRGFPQTRDQTRSPALWADALPSEPSGNHIPLGNCKVKKKKNTSRYHDMPFRMASVQRLTTPNAGKDVNQ